MADKKRATTAPPTHDDVAEQLDAIPPEEFLARFDEIIARDMALPGALAELLTLDEYMETELRETFQSIVAQYVRPVEFAVGKVLAGEQSKRIAGEGLEALGPILSAADSLKYDDIAAQLREIERPLAELREGARRRLTKKDTADLEAAWERLRSALRLGDDRAAAEPAGVPLSAIPRHVGGVETSHVRTLRGAGLASMSDLAAAPAADIAALTGLAAGAAERVRAFAAGATAAGAAGGRPKRSSVPPGWMRVRVDSDVLRARVTFRYGTLGRYVEPILARLAAEAGREAPARPAAPDKARAPRASRARGGETRRAR